MIRMLWHLIVKRHEVTRFSPLRLYVCECGASHG